MAAPSKSNPDELWSKATTLRWLAREILPGEFRNSLLSQAIHYELRAARLQGAVIADHRSTETQPSLTSL